MRATGASTVLTSFNHCFFINPPNYAFLKGMPVAFSKNMQALAPPDCLNVVKHHYGLMAPPQPLPFSRYFSNAGKFWLVCVKQ